MHLARTQPTWGLGLADEVWWSRLAHPEQHQWIEADRIPRLYALESTKDDADPKALACYGLLVRCAPQYADQMLLRFVDGRPVRSNGRVYGCASDSSYASEPTRTTS